MVNMRVRQNHGVNTGSVDRQRLLVSAPGKPANVDFHASTMRVQLGLLGFGFAAALCA